MSEDVLTPSRVSQDLLTPPYIMGLKRIRAFQDAAIAGAERGAGALVQISREIGQSEGRPLKPEESYTLLFVSMARAMDYVVDDEGKHPEGGRAPFSKPQHVPMAAAFKKYEQLLGLGPDW